MTHNQAAVDLPPPAYPPGLIHPAAPTPASNPRRSCYPDYPEPASPPKNGRGIRPRGRTAHQQRATHVAEAIVA